MSCRPLRCPPNSVLAAEAPPDAFGIAIGRHATVDSIISVTRLIPCAGAQYVTPAEKNMLLCEAAANGKLMKEYGIISRKPRALGYVAAGLAVLGGRFPSNSVRTFNCKAAAGAFDVANPTADQLGMWLTRLCKLNSLLASGAPKPAAIDATNATELASAVALPAAYQPAKPDPEPEPNPDPGPELAAAPPVLSVSEQLAAKRDRQAPAHPLAFCCLPPTLSDSTPPARTPCCRLSTLTSTVQT